MTLLVGNHPSILASYAADSDKSPDRVLNKIFQELTLRYVTLREFYLSPESKQVRFECEHANELGSIDLVLTTGDGRYAIEIKRWQTKKEQDEILGKDFDKLDCFQRGACDNRAYELIYSVIANTTEDIQMPNELYVNEFKDVFNEKFDLLECRTLVPPNNATFRIAIYLAALARR